MNCKITEISLIIRDLNKMPENFNTISYNTYKKEYSQWREDKDIRAAKRQEYLRRNPDSIKDYFADGSEFGYAKRRLKGSLIGFTRGLISGFIMLSLLGSLFFIVSGGRGNEKSPQYDLGNEDYNNIKCI